MIWLHNTLMLHLYVALGKHILRCPQEVVTRAKAYHLNPNIGTFSQIVYVAPGQHTALAEGARAHKSAGKTAISLRLVVRQCPTNDAAQQPARAHPQGADG